MRHLNRTDYWSMGRIDLRKSETVSLRTSSTPAGSGVGSSGGVQAWIDGPSNFTEATFNLYKRNDPNTVIATQRSTRPYEGVTFFNLPKGDYTVIATAKPGCTPTTTASNWNDGAFKLAGNVSVGTFNLIATAIPSRGTCPGGVKVEASKVTGVQQIVYNLATQQDPNTVVQTYTANYPNFAHTFTGLATGKYVVSATEMTGNSKMQTNFEVRSQNDAPSVTLINHTMTGMAEGKVNVRVGQYLRSLPGETHCATHKYGLGAALHHDREEQPHGRKCAHRQSACRQLFGDCRIRRTEFLSPPLSFLNLGSVLPTAELQVLKPTVIRRAV